MLDPIDWATYEPHLWAHAQRYYGRTAVLLGTLAQLSRPYGDAGARPAPGAPAADINTLSVLPVVPRFHYLPISTPSAASLSRARGAALAAQVLGATDGSAAGGGAGGWQPGAGAARPAAAGAGDAQASDLAALYLVSDVSTSTITRGANVDGGGVTAPVPSFLAPGAAAADSAAAAGASALSALQAKLQGSSFTALGSMLGDRAAEVTAMAQNFGDLLPTAGGLGGGLGGLGQSAVGGLLSSFARREGAPQH
jgi:hypothetical protein